jgi:hypothetical protein
MDDNGRPAALVEVDDDAVDIAWCAPGCRH